LGPRADSGARTSVRREVNPDGRGRLVAEFDRDGVVRWINDPEVGDRIAVAVLGGPARGVDVRRATLEAAVLPAAHGAVIEPRADGVQAVFEDGALVVTRGEGLIAGAGDLTTAQAEFNAALLAAQMGEAGDAREGAALSGREILARIDDLMRRAAAEGVREGAPVDARMALARFLLENEFAAEALGALRVVAINQGQLVELDPEFRMMRGAANVMMGRTQDALADLNASALTDDMSAALWRGYAAALVEDWAEARREFDRGAGALETHPPSWRARFQLALANAALELNDLATAEAAAHAAMGQATSQNTRLHSRLIAARIAMARGDVDAALPLLDELSRVRDEEVAVRASLHSLRLRRRTGVMRPIDLVEPMEALRFRWRGDTIELKIVADLGEVYSELGRWRDAMATMRAAADRFPGHPAGRRVRAEMSTLFERLFLDGEAGGIEPIQALGLFYEFSDLTPPGPNGDRIVRLLAGRLVNVDLLEQAAQLLQHQVDERLDGVGQAQVAADLATIYLLDGKPDRALVTLNSTRQPNMPTSLLAERRVLEARALIGLGRLDHAAELVERDRSADAQRVRAEAAWRARDWERAAVELRALVAMRDRSSLLDSDGRQAVLRAGVALTLSGNEAGVQALYRDFAGDMTGTPEADAFEVVAAGIHAEGTSIRDVARVVARTDLLDRFLQNIRARMTAEAPASDTADAVEPGHAPAPGAPSPQAPAPQTPALPAGQQRATPEGAPAA
jgi:tetratricopeptide (TPR) repeat protein